MKTICRKCGGWLLLVALAPTLLAAPASQPSPPEEAEKLFQAGQAEKAVEVLRQDLRAHESDPYRLYNLGLAMYRAGRLDEAMNVLQSVDGSHDKELQSRTSLQMGNVQFRLAQQLKKSREMVGATLSLERALGYYETAREIKPARESSNNRLATASQLEDTLLGIAQSSTNNAARLDGLIRQAEAEPLWRRVVQAYQRVGEIDPGNAAIAPQLAQATARLVTNLEQHASQLGKEADEAKDLKLSKSRRQQSINKYNDALVFEPNSTKLQADRTEQLRKMSALLTDEAEKQSAPALEKEPPTLDTKEQGTLEQAKNTLETALSLDSENTRATNLRQRIFQELEDSYVAEGTQALKDEETVPGAQDKLDLVKKAVDQFQKALDQNAQNRPAQAGLAKAEAMLADLYAAAGKEALDQAKALQTGPAPSVHALSDKDLQTSKELLSKSVENSGTSLGMKPGQVPVEKNLAEAQALLDAVNDEASKRLAAAQAGGPPPKIGAGEGGGDAAGPGEGQMLPLSYDNSSRKPLRDDKFWDKKIRDW